MKRENSIRIDELIRLFVKEYGLEEGLLRTRVFKAWDETVGIRYTRSTSGKFFRDGILYCNITSSVAKSYLFMNRARIAEDINRILDADVVKEIVLR